MSAVKIIASLDELTGCVGMALPPSSTHVITQDRIDGFAALTGDDQWIHTDPARAAKELDEGRTLVQGQLLLSLTPKLLNEMYRITFASSCRFIGYGDVRFRHALICDQAFRLQAVIESVKARGGLIRVVTALTCITDADTVIFMAQRMDAYVLGD